MIVVGSTNPSKVRPVQDVMSACFPGVEVRGVAVASGVPDQPVGVAETRLGAMNRAAAALAVPGATWGLGLEGGVEFDEAGAAWLFGIVAIAGEGGVSSTRTASMELPRSVGDRVRGGEALGTVIEDLSGVAENNRKTGAFGFLTSGMLERADVWRQGVILALVPHLKRSLYLTE